MKLVFICSPYKGDIGSNTLKAQCYCHFAYNEGVVPFAPHLHNTQFLADGISEEREAGIRMGLEILKKCDELWVFGSLISSGMENELRAARQLNKPIRYFNEKCEEVVKR